PSSSGIPRTTRASRQVDFYQPWRGAAYEEEVHAARRPHARSRGAERPGAGVPSGAREDGTPGGELLRGVLHGDRARLPVAPGEEPDRSGPDGLLLLPRDARRRDPGRDRTGTVPGARAPEGKGGGPQ